MLNKEKARSLTDKIGIGILGMGVVGSGVAKTLFEKKEHLESLIGTAISVEAILVRDLTKARDYQPNPSLLTSTPGDVVNNPNVDIVVELMGGEEPAFDYVCKSIDLGKNVATANKELMAHHGPEILTRASNQGVHVMFEGSVGGGTPIIGPIRRDLVANNVVAINGIINGTTNYILTRMGQAGVDFDVALSEAQKMGYAEADATQDVEGIDAANKLAILSNLAFGAKVTVSDVHQEGITRLKSRDFLYARELGYSIKLMAMARKTAGKLQLRVHPVFVPYDVLMARVDGVFNAVEIETDLAGRVLFHGPGAGSLPTSSAVVADIVNISRNVVGNLKSTIPIAIDETLSIQPMCELETKYYVRVIVEDKPGVLAQIARILGESNTSIDSVLQKGTNEAAGTAELVLMTHRARESSMQEAINLLKSLPVVYEIGNVVRVEEWV